MCFASCVDLVEGAVLKWLEISDVALISNESIFKELRLSGDESVGEIVAYLSIDLFKMKTCLL